MPPPFVDLKIKTEELGVLFKTVPRKTTVHYMRGELHSNWPNYRHVMLRVEPHKSGRQWVIDVTGAQHGIIEVLHERSKYERDYYVDRVVGVNQLGAHRRILTEVAKGAGMVALTYGAYRQSYLCARQGPGCIGDAEPVTQDDGSSPREVWTQPHLPRW